MHEPNIVCSSSSSRRPQGEAVGGSWVVISRVIRGLGPRVFLRVL